MFPHLVTATNVPTLVKIGDVNWADVDAAFCCLPHATTQEILNSLPRHIKVVDLSADFRLKDVNVYAEWCGRPGPQWTCSGQDAVMPPLRIGPLGVGGRGGGWGLTAQAAWRRYGGEHKAPELQREAVYGLTELHREQVRGARLVANPGCYPHLRAAAPVPPAAGGHPRFRTAPTLSAPLPSSPVLVGGEAEESTERGAGGGEGGGELVSPARQPLVAAQAGLIETEDIIIDAKSGVSGAGRSAKQNLLYTEIAEGINCYGVGSHRHMPEIEQARALHLIPACLGRRCSLFGPVLEACRGVFCQACNLHRCCRA